MDISEMQLEVDRWIRQFAEGYWQPSSMTLRLMEEVGELAREVNHLYGEKPKKPEEPETDLELELGDILFIILCFANAQGLDLNRSFTRVMQKYYERDSHRWTRLNP
ncbi:MAG: nucleotide pyrophosphohydrolase [Bacillota bacterium]|uniref:Nucleotide pyrophosphohydrolase n=1 Tax=Thermanaerosceptrum fracticalcis TaxID=1712410 RepID=A0A7G6E8A7_THEFR|nr:nucleotide pyrophosphohydrolase [Thermanaerosceptrum fracticalcis]QNB48311.1 nucleotide pyrophosphohydrolase [Thermanaerosceptrum fracticalcis]